MYKSLLSLSLLLCSLCGLAQQTDSTGFFVIPGVTITPFALGKGYSASAYYSIQFGAYQYPVNGVVRFGVPRYASEVSSDNNVDYSISGAYVQPGFLVYFGNLGTDKQVFYMGLLGYFGVYQHNLKMEITDPYWGTSEQYNLTNDIKANGILFEMGGMITLHQQLKMSMSLNTGKVWMPENPITQIANFTNQSTVIPGAGYGNELLIGMNIGLHYILD